MDPKADAAVGATAISAVVPYYYAYDDAAIVGHYSALLEACSGADVYAYTIPARTVNELSPSAVRTLGAAGLRGVKDSTKSFERLLEYLDCGVDVLIGTDAFVRDGLAAGAAGCVSVIAIVRPDLFCALREGTHVQEEIGALASSLSLPRLEGGRRGADPRLPGPLPAAPVVSVLTVGETLGLIDPGEAGPLRLGMPLTLRIAGAESNVAIALARLGVPVRWISRLGEDPIGDVILAALESERVDTRFVARQPGRTGMFIEWREDGRTSVAYHRAGSAACSLSPADVPDEALEGVRLVH